MCYINILIFVVWAGKLDGKALTHKGKEWDQFEQPFWPHPKWRFRSPCSSCAIRPVLAIGVQHLHIHLSPIKRNTAAGKAPAPFIRLGCGQPTFPWAPTVTKSHWALPRTCDGVWHTHLAVIIPFHTSLFAVVIPSNTAALHPTLLQPTIDGADNQNHPKISVSSLLANNNVLSGNKNQQKVCRPLKARVERGLGCNRQHFHRNHHRHRRHRRHQKISYLQHQGNTEHNRHPAFPSRGGQRESLSGSSNNSRPRASFAQRCDPASPSSPQV